MTEIIITAGGTSEPIDGVRKISNSSTGSLSACIYGALADEVNARKARPEDFLVHYVVSRTAVRPEACPGMPIRFYPVEDVESVRRVLEKLLTERPIACVIHGMAVSDFTTGYVVPREALASELAAAVKKAVAAGPESSAALVLDEMIARILERPAHALATGKKVSSGSELMLSLVKTPKLIGLIKQWNPAVFLVGFKLLKGVSEEELVRVASCLAEQNRCDLVLANDLTTITANTHRGLLVCGGAVAGRFETKREIAAGIAAYVLGALGAGRSL